MGKRSRERMTGLKPKGRVQRSIKRKAAEVRKKAKLMKEMFRQMLEATTRRQRIEKPLAKVIVRHENLPERVTIRDQFVLDDIERKLRIKAVKGEKKSD